MNKYLILSFFLFHTILSIKTTFDNDFESSYKVEHIKDGDGETYPQKKDYVSINYRGISKDGHVFDSNKDGPKKFMIGVGQVNRCWDNTIMRMSLGEKTKVVCPAKDFYYKSDQSFEFELVKIDQYEEDL